MPLAHAQVKDVLQVFFNYRANLLSFAEAVERVVAAFSDVDRWEVLTTVAAACFATGGSAATWAAKEGLRRECAAYLRRQCLGGGMILHALALHAADLDIKDFAHYAERCFDVLVHAAFSADGKVEGRSPLTRLGNRLARRGNAGLRAEDAIPALVDRIARELMIVAGCRAGNSKAIEKLCSLLLASVQAELAWFRRCIGSVALKEMNPEAVAWEIASRIASNDAMCDAWQRIDAWDPLQSALGTWLDSVVKGRQHPGKPRLTREGMLFKYLKALRVVDYLQVVLRECHNVAHHNKEKQFVQYRGEQCPVCGSAFFETRDRLLVRHRIVGLGDIEKLQCGVRLYLCGKCKNFFRASLKSCPYIPPGHEEPCGGAPITGNRGRPKRMTAFDPALAGQSSGAPDGGGPLNLAGLAGFDFGTLDFRIAFEEAAKATHEELEEKSGLALILFLLTAVEGDLQRLLALSHPRVIPLFTDEEYCSLGETIVFERRDWTTVLDILRDHLPQITRVLEVDVNEAITYDNVRHVFCTQVRQRFLANVRTILSGD